MPVNLTETSFYSHEEVRPSAKRGLLKVAPQPNWLPTPDAGDILVLSQCVSLNVSRCLSDQLIKWKNVKSQSCIFIGRYSTTAANEEILVILELLKKELMFSPLLFG